jgi:hypothetical protein
VGVHGGADAPQPLLVMGIYIFKMFGLYPGPPIIRRMGRNGKVRGGKEDRLQPPSPYKILAAPVERSTQSFAP